LVGFFSKTLKGSRSSQTKVEKWKNNGHMDGWIVEVY